MATIYINADSGDDGAGDGSSGNPWLTVSKAHTEATAGDTVVCQDSTATYAWQSITFTKALTIQGEQADASGAVFDGGGSTSSKWQDIQNGTIIKNITFQNIYRTNAEGLFLLADNLDIEFTLENCIFKDIQLYSHPNYDSRYSGLISKYSGATSVIYNITNCLFNDVKRVSADAGSFGVNLFGYGNSANLAFNITGSTFRFLASGSEQMDQVLGSYENCAIVVAVKNTIFSNESGGTVELLEDHGSGTVFSGDVEACCLYNMSSTTPDAVTNTNCITSDPLFVDAANDDFSLRPSSPCIGTGVLT